MQLKVPRSLGRLAEEIKGWLELGCPEKALEKLGPLLGNPGARPAALTMSVHALVELGRYTDALPMLCELRASEQDPEWLEVTEAWCRKRSDDLDGAITCMERLLDANRRSAIGHFNLGCYLALRGDLDRAIDEVSLACGIDDRFRELAADEDDLASLRDDRRFQRLLPRRSS